MENENAPATKADVAVVKADVAVVKADVAVVKADVAGIKANIAVINERIDVLHSDVVTVNERIDVLHSDVVTVNERIDMLRSETSHAFDELKETMRDGQTELLKAFYNYAQSADAKLKEGEVADFLIRGRLTAMESRQTDMERRLNTPPPPQN